MCNKKGKGEEKVKNPNLLKGLAAALSAVVWKRQSHSHRFTVLLILERRVSQGEL